MVNTLILKPLVRLSCLGARWQQRCLVASMAALPASALADGDFADMANRLADGATTGIRSALKIAQFIGVLFVIGGLIAAKTKKDNPHVKTWHILASILFGVCLIVVPEIIKRAQTQVGLSPVSIG